jgi:hypothetical protein
MLISSVPLSIAVFAQSSGGAYGAGQVVGVIFMVALVGAILWKLFKR